MHCLNTNFLHQNTFVVNVNPLGDPAYEHDPEMTLSSWQIQYYIHVQPMPYLYQQRGCEMNLNTWKECGDNKFAKFWKC